MNHYPFDHGSLDDAFGQLGLVVRQKTIKAECGKRVAYASADHKARIDCPSCREKLAATKAQLKNDLPMWQSAAGISSESITSLVDATNRRIEQIDNALSA